MLLWITILCACSFVSSAPSDPTPKCGYESCTEARNGYLNVHIVAHTHDDVGWLKTVDQYYYGSNNSIQLAGVQYILDSVIKELSANPKRRFIYVETAFFWKWWVNQDPDTQTEVHRLVNNGQLMFVGGAWSMNDEAASHYQSTIDQFTWGIGKLVDTFGQCAIPRVAWQIDPFGHSREFASLLAGMGYDGLFLGRIDYQDKVNRKKRLSMETLWRGDDDLGKSSDIFTGVLYNTYQPPPGFCFDILCSDAPIIDDIHSPLYNVDERVTTFIEIAKNMALSYNTNNILITMGEDFNYQMANMWFGNLDKLIEYTNLKSGKEDLKIKLFYSTPTCYLKAVHDANPALPTKQDDFFPYASDPHAYWTGYFTSRPTTKYFEREGNGYLQMAKQLQVLSGLEGHNDAVIDELKTAMGIMQHHDAITGTEKEHVTHDYERLLDQAIEDSIIVPQAAIDKLFQHNGEQSTAPSLSFKRCHLNESRCDVSETNDQFIVALYNPLAWHVNESIRIPVVNADYAVYAPNEDRIVSQIVEIPTEVLAIPSRKSAATHELVFIAYLKPLMLKTYYVQKTQSIVKRDVDSQNHNDNKDENVNKLFKKIMKPYNSETTQRADWVDVGVVDESNDIIVNLETRREFKDVDVANDLETKVMEELDLKQNYQRVGFENNQKPVRLEMVRSIEKSGRDLEGIDLEYNHEPKVIERLNIYGESRPESYQESRLMRRKLEYPQMDDKEMRMLSDDPDIVEIPIDNVIGNELIKLHINFTTGKITHATLADGTDVKLQIQFCFYPGTKGDNSKPEKRASGAYIFRPNATKPYDVETNMIPGAKGPVVKEIKIVSETASSIVRIYDGLNYIENEWIVGPIKVNDGIGKEYIVRYNTDLVNNKQFYTDSNGRQMLKRILNERPQWNLTIEEPVASNYYPVTNKIFIEDDKNRVVVLTDRSEGGTSLEEGQIELMLHRRLLNDDAFGVGEALDEKANGKGLVARGRHRILLTRLGNLKDKIEERKQVLQMHLQPRILIASAKDVSLEQWFSLKKKCESFANDLPEGVHLLTLEPWKDSKFLLRLENFLEKSDKNDASIEVDLNKIFKYLKVESFEETNLAGHVLKKDQEKKFTWKASDMFVAKPDDVSSLWDDGLKIALRAKQIRTFVVSGTK